MHTYDAQLAGGAPQPLPVELAIDGVEEFLFTVCATPSAWPHKPTAFDFHAAEGRSWRLTVDGDGARTTRIPAPTAATGEDSDAAMPPSTARPVSWSSTCTTGSRPTPCTLTETQGCSTCSAPGSRRRSRT